VNRYPIDRRKTSVRSDRGFTLIAVIVMVGVMAVLASVAVPSVFYSLRLSRENAVKEQLNAIETAIMGHSKQGTYGYVGDMGRFPNSLEELNIQGAQPSWTTDNYLSIGMGWRGPYVSEEFSVNDYLQDPWNMDYIFTVTTYPGVDSTTALVQSCGPDKQPDTEDDFFSDVMILKGNLRLIVTVGQSTQIPNAVTTDLYYVDDGTECQEPLQGEEVTLPGEKGKWSYIHIGPVHHGIHSLAIHVGAIHEVVAVDVVGGIDNDEWAAIPVGTKGTGKPTK